MIKRLAAVTMLTATILVITIPVRSTAQDDALSSWTRHLCLDGNEQVIGFQPPSEFNKLTYWRGYASLAKDVLNLWSEPSEVVVYSYPIKEFEISVNSPSEALRRDEISRWLSDPTGNLAIVSVC
ncbi:MAG: hypothetical protein OXC62_15780 [Aestuariivita sp.]|nr:hypothetical protein [Aestuariivita sp.]